MLRGRALDRARRRKRAPVAVINQRLCRALLRRTAPTPSQAYRDRRRRRSSRLPTEPERQIVGIVGDMRAEELNEVAAADDLRSARAAVRTSWHLSSSGAEPLAWLVRTTEDPQVLAAAIQSQLRDKHRCSGRPKCKRWPTSSRPPRRAQRFNMLLMSVFGGAALLLATVGIYGLIRYSAEQRTHELGIRAALGATPGRIRGMVLLQGGVLIGVGTAIGLGAAFGLANFLASLLFGVEPHDRARVPQCTRGTGRGRARRGRRRRVARGTRRSDERPAVGIARSNVNMWDTLIRDLRQAARGFARNPAFTLVAVPRSRSASARRRPCSASSTACC